jgi:hypothetical protein
MELPRYLIDAPLSQIFISMLAILCVHGEILSWMCKFVNIFGNKNHFDGNILQMIGGALSSMVNREANYSRNRMCVEKALRLEVTREECEKTKSQA